MEPGCAKAPLIERCERRNLKCHFAARKCSEGRLELGDVESRGQRNGQSRSNRLLPTSSKCLEIVERIGSPRRTLFRNELGESGFETTLGVTNCVALLPGRQLVGFSFQRPDRDFKHTEFHRSKHVVDRAGDCLEVAAERRWTPWRNASVSRSRSDDSKVGGEENVRR